MITNGEVTTRAHGDDGSALAYWAREIGVCAAITVMLVLDMDALGCAGGLALLDDVALHLWGPGY